MNREKLIELLSVEDFSPYYEEANRIKEEYYGKVIDIRAILEFSNVCRMDCAYCGLNRNNKSIERYRMNAEEIIRDATYAFKAGYKTIVLQSGDDTHYSPEMLGEIVKTIKKNTNNELKITLSCGEKLYEDYKYLKDCGADRYLLKHECCDDYIYKSMHTVSTLDNRLECLRNLKKIGYETGSGFMVGLPKQTLKTIADDILLLNDIPCDMAGIGPFVPHPDTPLRDEPKGSSEITKRAVALTRILMGKINLPATTSLEVVDKEERDSIFSCGANVIMRKVTPEKLKPLYEIYPNDKIKKSDNGNTLEQNEEEYFEMIKKERKELEAQIKALGCVPV